MIKLEVEIVLVLSNSREICMIVMDIDKNIHVHHAFSDVGMYLCEMCFQTQKEKKSLTLVLSDIAFVSPSDFCMQLTRFVSAAE